MPTPPVILAALVTGDIVVDSHLYGGIKTKASSHKEPGTVGIRGIPPSIPGQPHHYGSGEAESYQTAVRAATEALEA